MHGSCSAPLLRVAAEEILTVGLSIENAQRLRLLVAYILFSFLLKHSTKTKKLYLDMKRQLQISSHKQVKAVFCFIAEHYHQSISLSDVAKEIGYSPAYLTDLVRRETGQTVNQWIIEKRLTQASRLLLETNQTVSQIAETVGYQHINYFFRQFRKHYGSTPQVWRNSQRDSD